MEWRVALRNLQYSSPIYYGYETNAKMSLTFVYNEAEEATAQKSAAEQYYSEAAEKRQSERSDSPDLEIGHTRPPRKFTVFNIFWSPALIANYNVIIVCYLLALYHAFSPQEYIIHTLQAQKESSSRIL